VDGGHVDAVVACGLVLDHVDDGLGLGRGVGPAHLELAET
jgi:hypothetical protein